MDESGHCLDERFLAALMMWLVNSVRMTRPLWHLDQSVSPNRVQLNEHTFNQLFTSVSLRKYRETCTSSHVFVRSLFHHFIVYLCNLPSSVHV